jgi:hypothetical protein
MSRSQTPKPPPLSDAQQRELLKRASRVAAGAASVARGLVGLNATHELFEAAAEDLRDALDDRATRNRTADGFEPLR